MSCSETLDLTLINNSCANPIAARLAISRKARL